MAAIELNTSVLKTIHSGKLAGYYRGETGALTTDSSGNGKTLTNSGSVAEGVGVFGTCFDFGNSYAHAKRMYISDNMGVAGNGSLGISFWIKLNAEIASGTALIVRHGSQLTADRYFRLIYEYNGGTRRLGVDASGTISYYNITLGTTNWYLIYVIRTSGGVVGLYINGVKAIELSAAGTTAGGANLFDFGGDGTNLGVAALMDDVSFWNINVLTLDQVKELYEGRTVGEYITMPTQAYWHFNGNSTDFSGNNNHGTDTTITYSQNNGKFGQGAGFGGSSVITLADSASMKPANFTITCWLKTSTTGQLGTILSTYKNDETGWALQLTGTNNMRCYFKSTYIVTGSKNVADGAWHWIVFTYNGTGGQMYVDGTPDGAAVNGTYSYGTTPPIRIGALNNGSNTQFYTGALDELALFNVAKDAAWVRKQYAWSVGKFGGIP